MSITWLNGGLLLANNGSSALSGLEANKYDPGGWWNGGLLLANNGSSAEKGNGGIVL